MKRLKPIIFKCGTPLALSVAVIVVSVGLSARFTLIGNTDRRVDMGTFRDYARSDSLVFIFGIATLFGLYLGGLRMARNCRTCHLDGRYLFGGVGATIAFISMYPVTAIDIFIYAGQSRVWTELDANPNLIPIDKLGDERWSYFAGEWSDRASPYGPLWKWIASPSTLFSGDNFLASVLVLKLIAFAAVIGTAFLASDLARRRGLNPTSAFVAIAWNPLLLWEGIGNGHNDVVIALFVLAAIWFWSREHYEIAVPALTAAVLVKYTAVVMLPALALASLLIVPAVRRRSLLFWWIADCLLLTAFALWPYYQLQPLIEMIKDQGDITLTSPLWLATNLLDSSTVSQNDIENIYKPVAIILLIVLILASLLRIVRKPTAVPAMMLMALSSYLLVASWQFRAWYLIPVICLDAVISDRWSRIRTVLWSAGSLVAYAIFIWTRPEFDWQRNTRITVGTLAMFGPVVLLLTLEFSIRGYRAIAGRDQPKTSR